MVKNWITENYDLHDLVPGTKALYKEVKNKQLYVICCFNIIHCKHGMVIGIGICILKDQTQNGKYSNI